MSTKSLLKFKSSRSVSQNLWPNRKITPKQKLILSKIKKKKLSNFGSQLLSRRLLSILYGSLSSQHFKKAYQTAVSLQGKIGNNFLCLLEKRLDTVLFRMQICTTFRASRQLIVHNMVFVNNKLVNIPSFQLNPGDIINLAWIKGSSQSKESADSFRMTGKQEDSFRLISENSEKFFNQNLQCKTKALHLEVNYKTLSAVFLYAPQQLIYPVPFDISSLMK